MNSMGVWGEAWLTWKQGKPVLQLTARYHLGGQGGGGLLVQFSPPPILQMGKLRLGSSYYFIDSLLSA